MNKRISAPDNRRLARDENGATSIEFAMVVMLLLILSLGIVDSCLLAFDFTRAAEATRRGARIAAIEPPVGNLDNLANASVTCSSSGGTPDCNGVAVNDSATFDDVVAAMKDIYPEIGADNIRITYSASGVGTAESGGYKPYVQVSLTGFQRPFYALQKVTGVAPSITMPAFATTLLGNAYLPAG